MRGHYDNTPPRSFFGSTLGVIGVALGLGVIGAFALDLHSHTCDKCGRKWRHLGAFNAGDERAHSCPACGEAQWWKTGASPAQRDRLLVDQATAGLPMQEMPPNTIAAPPPSAIAAPLPLPQLEASKVPV